MSTKLILKKSSVGGKVPQTSDLEYGELAINYAEGRIFYKTSSNAIKNFVDSDQVIAHVATAVSALEALDSAGIITLITADGFTKYDSDNFNGQFSAKTTSDLTEGTNLYYTSVRADSDAKAAISVTDAGGDGSLTYANGVITYTGPSASEVRAHFSAGTGVSITDGSIAIGQAVSTTSDVTFAKITGDSAVLDQINFNTAYAGAEHIPFSEGAVWYDNYHKTLNYWSDDSNVIHEIGTEEHQKVYNNTGSLIEKGKPLYFSGNYNPGGGALPVPTVALADATDVNAYNAQGLASGDIANGDYGFVILSGRIDGIDTSSLNAGENFFVGLTPGAVQNASPLYPNYPMCLGWVVTSDSSDGVLIVNQQNHSVNSFRVRTSAHIGNDLIIDGNLQVNGTQTITSTQNVSIGGSIQYLNAGNTIGEANTVFIGSGLDDAFFAGHYSGDSSSKSFYVKIDATGTPDTFEWGHDSSVGPIATGIAITGAEQLLDSDYGIAIDFGATTGHTLNDKWTGTAAATDVDTGFFTNRNTGDAGSGYTHIGFFFDVSTNKWRLLDAYEPEPENPINIADPSISYGDLVLNQVEGNVIGTVSDISNHSTNDLTEGNLNLYYTTARADSDAKHAISAGTGISYSSTTGVISTNDSAIVHDNLSGFVANEHIDHSAVSITAGSGLTGGGTIAATRTINVGAGSYIVVNADDVAVDATSANTASKVVARDASGNFSAGTVTLAGDVVLDEFILNSQTATTTTISQTAIATFTAATYGGAEALITVKDGTDRHITKILIVHDGSTASSTEYGTITTTSSLSTFAVDISGGNVRILATPASTNSTVFNVALTLIDA